MKIHQLKILPEYFAPVCLGLKSFEIRENDRDFQVGDLVELREYLPNHDRYTGRVLPREITYVTAYAQQANYVVFGLGLLDESEGFSGDDRV